MRLFIKLFVLTIIMKSQLFCLLSILESKTLPDLGSFTLICYVKCNSQIITDFCSMKEAPIILKKQATHALITMAALCPWAQAIATFEYTHNNCLTCY